MSTTKRVRQKSDGSADKTQGIMSFVRELSGLSSGPMWGFAFLIALVAIFLATLLLKGGVGPLLVTILVLAISGMIFVLGILQMIMKFREHHAATGRVEALRRVEHEKDGVRRIPTF